MIGGPDGKRRLLLGHHRAACDCFREAVLERDTEAAIHYQGVAKGLELACFTLGIEIEVPVEYSIGLDGQRVTRLT